MTRADRLQALLEKVAPKKAAYYKEHNAWPLKDDDDMKAPQRGDDGRVVGSSQRGAPYEIKTLSGDRRRIAIVSDEGETLTGTGANVEEALTALEARVA